MKKILAIATFVALAFLFGISGSTTAVEQQFAERFAVGSSVDTKGESGTFNFDKAHSAIGFRIKHMGLVEVPGYFRDFTGSVDYNADDVTKSTVNFTAKSASIDTGVEARDRHLRTADFFEVEKYPELSFKSTKVEKKEDALMVTGDLTIKDVTKSVTFPVTVAGFLPANQRSGMRMGAQAATMINRRDFNVNYGSNLPGTNTPMLADNVMIWLQIEAIKPQAAKPAAE